MRKLFEILSVLPVLAVFSCGATSAHERELFLSQKLQPIFERINQNYFAGELRNVEVRWGNLKTDDAKGLTRAYGDGSFLIELDRASNTKTSDAENVLKHEACHVSTWPEIEKHKKHPDFHGPAFSSCMRRFLRTGAN